MWDLVKVVTAFTAAHTITLTLSVLGVVRLGEHVVEPMIAASIVFVAVQNVAWPRSSRGWGRIAVAFAFGLFHGLGFAGGLQEAIPLKTSEQENETVTFELFQPDAFGGPGAADSLQRRRPDRRRYRPCRAADHVHL